MKKLYKTFPLFFYFLVFLSPLAPRAMPLALQDEQEPVISLEGTLVMLPFLVLDKKGAPIANLSLEQVRVFEKYKTGGNKPVLREQTVTYFEQATETPLWVAILYDTSGSLTPLQISFQKGAIFDIAEQLLNTKSDSPKNWMLVGEFYNMIRKINRPNGFPVYEDVILDYLTRRSQHNASQSLAPHLDFNSSSYWTDSLDDIEKAVSGPVNAMTSRGDTPLFRAIDRVAREQFIPLRGKKFKILIIMSDGVNAMSPEKDTIGLDEAIASTQRAQILVYSLGLGNDKRGVKTLKKITSQTGGKAFFTKKLEPMEVYRLFTRIIYDARARYLVGYTPIALNISDRKGMPDRVSIHIEVGDWTNENGKRIWTKRKKYIIRHRMWRMMR